MGVVAKIETWWESLGITKEQGELVDKLLEPKAHPRCENCTNTIDPNSIHDCKGVYDEVRVYIGETVARSTKNRLVKKYNCMFDSPEMVQHIDNFRLKDVAGFEEKVAYFKQMRNDSVLRAKQLEYNWEEEEELWQS